MCPLTAEDTQRALDELQDRPLNFDPADRVNWTAEAGWRIDDYCQPLPPEAPGDPQPDGTWAKARQMLRDYEFADPRIVRAIYDPGGQLDGRNMLLEVHFWGLRFRFGVRVSGVIDEVRRVEGREVRVWGWSYATLQGHLETGQMDYAVWKWLDTGAVEFHIHVVSRASRVGNPIVRLGFRLFGRREQVRFAKRACERMAAAFAPGDPGHEECPGR
jgi:uncharacterized protein (UPF0548 family)